MPRGSCKGRCQLNGFSLEIIRIPDTPVKEAHVSPATNYNWKHRLQGLAKCKNCDYITAKPTPLGFRCPCCKAMLGRSIYYKGNKFAQLHKRID